MTKCWHKNGLLLDMRNLKRGEKMGNIIKINMYAECKGKQINNLKLEQLEKYI